MTAERIKGIDGLRGVLIIVIILVHIYPVVAGVKPSPLFHNFATFSVQVFFCLSGFLVFQSFLHKAPQEKRPVFNFYVRRFFRIVPLWWCVAIFIFWIKRSPSEALFVNLFFVFGFLQFDSRYVLLIPAWSLFVEEIFYLFAPFIFRRFTKDNCLPLIFIAAFLGLLWLRYAGDFGVPRTNHFVGFFPLVHLRYFFLGMALLFLYQSPRLEKLSTQLRPWMDGLLICGISSVCFHLSGIRDLVFPVLVLSALISGTLSSKVYSWWLFRWIGVRCYGFYLLHSLVIPVSHQTCLKILGRSDLLGVKVTIVFLLTLGFTALVAGLSFRFLERPLMGFGYRLTEYSGRHDG